MTKRFPGGVVANRSVDLDVAVGEVHALLGENGAGKSTLSNVFTGLYRPDEGSIRVDGEPVVFHSPRDAIAAGIGMVHQHFRLVPTFTVAENLALGGSGPVARRQIEQRVHELGERYDLAVDPTARIWQLSVGQQQRVEILKVLAQDARILILDEPTAVLTPQEAEALFAVLRTMTAEGRSVVFISHKLDEVRAVADRVTVLRDGRSEGTRSVAGTDSGELARLMVGRDVVLAASLVEHPADRVDHRGDRGSDRGSDRDRDRVVVGAIRGIEVSDDRGAPALRGIDLSVHAGEVVGVCGVAGNGQRELVEVLSGTRVPQRGTVEVDGVDVTGAGPRRVRRAGLAAIPEDRLHEGVSPSLAVEDNLALMAYASAPLSSGPFLRRPRIRERAVDLIERFDIRTPGPTTPTRLLSGGNVQKVLLARELSSDPKVLVAASPTRGLDVGAIETVRGVLVEAANRGVGVLLVSEDLDEVLSLSDRVAVIFEGRILAVIDRADADQETIGLLMGGDTSRLASVDTTDRGGVGAGEPATGGDGA
ncbi:MAG TPA: ABC transporter ATP-binding protein [Acidimicrobiales bacterium]|nr:ABC transporter ATP-binding protein [Acidimicrobiales bacterium]